MLALIFIGAVSGMRLQAGVLGEAAISVRSGTNARQYDYVLGGELGAAPLWVRDGEARGKDYLRLKTSVVVGSLGAKATDSTSAVRVTSSDVRWRSEVFGYYPFELLPWLWLRVGALVGLDVSFRPTTTEVLGQRSQFTAIAPGISYGLRAELDMWHFFVALQGSGSTNVMAAAAHTTWFAGGTIGAHFDWSWGEGPEKGRDAEPLTRALRAAPLPQAGEGSGS